MEKNKSNRVYTNEGGNPAFVIEPLLPLGKENAISSEELTKIFNCTDRELRAIVSRERKSGAIICSATTGGYFKPKTKEELQAFYKGLKGQALSILEALRSSKRALDEMEGQESLGERIEN
ncbi:hypothetical protein M2150_002713 [Lachnospiraceae bacterium PM6-15]|uniref:hypothetical protein n=1 Tax=Ohessyouella blattaphilus TaxID=2949333 RepID=UPI003E2D0423